MDAQRYNQDRYLQRRQDLNVVLAEIHARGGLGAAIQALVAQQLDAGFVEDDLRKVKHYLVRHPAEPSRAFSVQFNPRRALRHAGAGRPAPPPGHVSVNEGCFLCDDNVAWQQRGLELGFDITLDGVGYCCYANPFPLMPSHVTVATKEHRPQGWSTDAGAGPTLHGVLSHLLTLAEQLPSFVVFFNGPDAGASIPAHFHYQLFRRTPTYAMFPLERSPVRQREGGTTGPAFKDYPIAVACFDRADGSIVERASDWFLGLASRSACAETASANFIATHTDGRLHLYVAPRHRLYAYAPGFAGLVGGLEILGELVLSMEHEKQELDCGRFDYQRVASVLQAVEPPGLQAS